ncbi:MAG: hypothetical protein ACT4TC_24610 [Myxococcaceae bacterium]
MTNALQPELIGFFSQGTGLWMALAAGVGAMAAWMIAQAKAPVPVPVKLRRNPRRRR